MQENNLDQNLENLPEPPPLTPELKEDIIFTLLKRIYAILLKMGFSFSSREEFEEFMGERVTELSFEENPDYMEIWLDYESGDERKFILSYDGKFIKRWEIPVRHSDSEDHLVLVHENVNGLHYDVDENFLAKLDEEPVGK